MIWKSVIKICHGCRWLTRSSKTWCNPEIFEFNTKIIKALLLDSVIENLLMPRIRPNAWLENRCAINFERMKFHKLEIAKHIIPYNYFEFWIQFFHLFANLYDELWEKEGFACFFDKELAFLTGCKVEYFICSQMYVTKVIFSKKLNILFNHCDD